MYPGFLLILLLIPLSGCAPLTTEEAADFLQSFYITPASLRSDDDGESRDPEIVRTEAIKMFQEGAGIAVTGELDEATKEKMAAPRCGVPEFVSLTNGEVWWWPKKALTYSLDTSGSGMTNAVTRNAMKNAFAVWSAVTPLKFTEVQGEGDINVKFGRRAHHGCGARFDGSSMNRGKILAHAFSPEEGTIHFDADEKWTVMSANHLPVSTHIDFPTVAIHEIGHALGLSHIFDNPSSILAPSYNRPIDQWGMFVAPKLDKEVISKIQRLYGKAPTATPPSTSYVANAPSGKYCLWAANSKYVRAHAPGGNWKVDLAPHCRALEHWTAQVVDDGKVAFRSATGKYLRGVPDGTLQVVDWRYAQEKWTAYGNTDDNSWSFKSAHGTWMSSHLGNHPTLQPHNKRLEHWWLVPVN